MTNSAVGSRVFFRVRNDYVTEAVTVESLDKSMNGRWV